MGRPKRAADGGLIYHVLKCVAGEGPNQSAATMTQFAAKQYTKCSSLISVQFFRLPSETEREYACRASTTTDDWKSEDPNTPRSPWWYTTEPATRVGFRLACQLQVHPLQVLQMRKEAEKLWESAIRRFPRTSNYIPFRFFRLNSC